jgi:F0F1-type ATP synthase membrane subunit b/b'
LSYIFPLINFVLFVIILWAILRRPVQIYFSTRSERFKAGIRLATKRRIAAEARLQESEARLIYIVEDLDDLAREMEREGNRQSESIVNTAKEKADSLHLDARRRATQEMMHMYHDVYRHSVNKAFEQADKKVHKKLGQKEAEDLCSRSIDFISHGLSHVEEQV